MRRILLSRYTGPIADDLAVAQRVSKKLRGAQRTGECVLLDCDHVLIGPSFLEVLVKQSHLDKVRFCGLSPSNQRLIQKMLGAQDGATESTPIKLEKTMKTLIIEVDACEPHSVLLNVQIAGTLDRVSRVADKILMNRPAPQDAASCDHLARFLNGAGVLARLGDPEEPEMRTDARSVIDAHTASCEVAGSKSLSQEERLDVLTALGFLGGILPCWVFAENLPPWTEIPNYGRSGGRVQKIYEALVQERTNGDGLRLIRMSEALALYGGLKLIVHPAILHLWEDLGQVTASHRRALACLMGKGRLTKKQQRCD